MSEHDYNELRADEADAAGREEEMAQDREREALACADADQDEENERVAICMADPVADALHFWLDGRRAEFARMIEFNERRAA